MSLKKYLDMNVYDAACDRMRFVFENFEKVYFSFSAGKDSSVMLHIALDIAKELGKLPVNVLFIDLEAQYAHTIKHAEEMLTRDDVNAYWICLPLNLRNAVSVYQSQWMCWDEVVRDKWVRDLPRHDCVISEVSHFPFFRKGMEFEQFVVEFGEWFSAGARTACGVGIRTDESLNRFRTILSTSKERFDDKPWTTRVDGELYNFYPLYDWRTEDVWTAVGKNGWSYNKIYDLMYQQGRSIHECRICQPYGDDQRKGLDLFRSCEPETWSKVVDRVSGANFGNIYCRSFLLGHKKTILPKGHTWKSYAEFLMDTIPKFEREWYQAKFDVFFAWWAEHGFPIEKVPDASLPPKHPSLRKDDGGYYEKGPSWERIAKVILKNDKLCKGLSFAQTRYQYARYLKLRELYGE